MAQSFPNVASTNLTNFNKSRNELFLEPINYTSLVPSKPTFVSLWADKKPIHLQLPDV